MTRSNRTLNRVILALLGLIALSGAAALALPWLDVPTPFLASGDAVVQGLGEPTVLWIGVGAAAVIVALSIAWIATRGRGHTTAAWEDDALRIDGRVVEDMLQTGLAANADVLGVSATPYRLRGARILGVRVICRRRTAVPLLLQDLRRAVAELDATFGTPLPLVIHVSGGTRSRFRSATAIH
ncbi:hypothetical protein [Microbacterium sp. SORGH_AS_0888]|uniref:hypothetical protein n=1 Tax=Microbacterium sp. SORGH_AS_0888 TaxID=3041791 RepID=UPI002780A009|nr:hypothetical protein [Microbacterium sp. SORGH_AS_0888]MDQ1131199.1 hypothetical protein [Microbacterium sp. SORGH_AS_0888]